eukprot:IDg3139t1
MDIDESHYTLALTSWLARQRKRRDAGGLSSAGLGRSPQARPSPVPLSASPLIAKKSSPVRRGSKRQGSPIAASGERPPTPTQVVRSSSDRSRSAPSPSSTPRAHSGP